MSDFVSDEEINKSYKQPVKNPTPPKIPIPKVTLGNIKEFDNGIKATNWKFGVTQYDDKDFNFKTLEVLIKDKRGDERPAYTIGRYIIRPNSKTKWTVYDKNALYYIRTGSAWFLIGEDGKPLTIMYYVCVPSETRHIIANQSQNMDCIVEVVFPGQIMLG